MIMKRVIETLTPHLIPVVMRAVLGVKDGDKLCEYARVSADGDSVTQIIQTWESTVVPCVDQYARKVDVLDDGISSNFRG